MLSRYPVPALIIAVAGAAALFAALTAAVFYAGAGDVARLDAAASALVAPYRAPWLLATFLWITTLGTGAALFGTAVTATGFLWADRRAGLVVPLWAAFAGAQASVWTVKYAIRRARPDFLPGVATAASPSFPSAHAAGTAATFGFIAYAVARGFPKGSRQRTWVVSCTMAMVALIDFSRVFLGVHFLSDVLGGLLLGAAWLFVGLALVERPQR